MQHSLTPIFKAFSPVLPVGAQHYYKHSWDALSTIYSREGLRGMVRGIDAAILRTAMGSSVQLPTYNWTKNQLVSRGILPANSVLTYLASSSVSGVCVVSFINFLSSYERLIHSGQLLMMQPADTVRPYFILTMPKPVIIVPFRL